MPVANERFKKSFLALLSNGYLVVTEKFEVAMEHGILWNPLL
jgi:hypothetical protein